VEMTVSTLHQGAKVFADGASFKLQYDMDIDVVLRRANGTHVTGGVGMSQITPRGLVPVPGHFHHEEEPRNRPYLLNGRELWGQSFRAAAPGIPEARASFLALWTIEAADPDRAHWDEAMDMPHRQAVKTVRDSLNDGAHLETAAFLAGIAQGVAVRWALNQVWPPCEFEGQDVGLCGCGEEHWAPW
jgi:hypothetical protein